MEKDRLSNHVELGHTTRKIAQLEGVSQTTVNHYLKKYELSTKRSRKATAGKYNEFFGNKETLEKDIESVSSIAELFRKYNLRASQASYRIFYRYCEEYGITPPKADGSTVSMAARLANKRSYEEILVKNSTYSSSSGLKKRLVSDGILEDKCASCGGSDTWNGEPITLQLDHINGVRDDNRIENLRILCPNCHSQTSTHSGKKPKNTCLDRDSRVSKKAERCRTCANKLNNSNPEYKIEWPEINELVEMLSNQPFTKVAEKLGVSDNAIRSHLKKRGIDPKAL